MTKARWMNNTDDVVRVFVVRHGQTQWNIDRRLQGHKNIPLNETGVKQAALLGQRLKEYEFDYVISSDLQRCVQTLEQVLGSVKTVETTTNLRERYMGDVEGMYIKDAREKYGAGFRSRGETEEALIARLGQEWQSLLKKSVANGYHNVLLCAHGGVITNFFRHLYHDKGYKLGEEVVSEELLVPYNTSLTIVDVKSDNLSEGTIQMWASTDHLGGAKSVQDQQLV